MEIKIFIKCLTTNLIFNNHGIKQVKTKNNLCLTILTVLLFLFLPQFIQAQPWEEDNHIFNPTGIPSLSFSQPRFYDLDNDGDLDMILGSTVQAPLYFKNTGSKTTPKFVMDKSLFANVNSLNAEMGVCVDIDADGDLDFVTGGYTGLHLYENIGSNMQPEFMESTNIFAQLSVGENPIPTLADMDGDGDIDLAVGLSEDGGVKYYTNSGLKDSPEFLESNGVRWFDVGLYAYPYFVDLDKDGDTDLLVGSTTRILAIRLPTIGVTKVRFSKQLEQQPTGIQALWLIFQAMGKLILYLDPLPDKYFIIPTPEQT